MSCPFLIRTKKGFKCEVLSEGPANEPRFAPFCKGDPYSHKSCSVFTDALYAFDSPTQEAVTQEEPSTAWHIGHINRIGGMKTILAELS